MFRCLPALTASAPAGTSSRTVVPVPTYAPSPTVTGAMSCVSLPMNAPSSIVVVVLLRAVVVAGDRAGADVDVRADHRVAEIGEVHRLRAGAETRLLHLDEVADLGARRRSTRPLRRCANGPIVASLADRRRS